MASTAEGIGPLFKYGYPGCGFRVGRVCLSVPEFDDFPCRKIWLLFLVRDDAGVISPRECFHVFRAYHMCIFHGSLLRKFSEWGSRVVVKY